MQIGGLKTVDGRLKIGGCDAVYLAKEYGTPLYVLDVDYVENTARAYVDILKREYRDFTVCYASKAFCCKGIYSLLAPLGLGADVVSGGELYTALSGGMKACNIYFHGNNKSEHEIKYAIDSGVECFVVDSEHELDLISRYAKKPQNVLVRVNPGVEAHTHRFIQTTTPDSKFGFAIADGTAEKFIKRAVAAENIAFKGIACHIGSQIFEIEPFKIAIDKMTDFIVRLNSIGIEVERLDLGGGFGIRYTEADKPLSPFEYMSASVKHLKAVVKSKNIKPPHLIVEPGRSIVGEAGVTLYTVGAIKTIENIKTYAAVDGGMFDNVRPSLYDAEYTAVIADRVDGPREQTYSIAGKCCESGDVLIREVALPELHCGDIIAVLSTGAYCYSMASNYNRNTVPPVVAVKNGRSCYMVKPQTYDDIVRNDVVPIF